MNVIGVEFQFSWRGPTMNLNEQGGAGGIKVVPKRKLPKPIFQQFTEILLYFFYYPLRTLRV